MVKTIMVATDFSRCGNSAIDYTFELAEQMKAKVILFTVIEREHHESSYFIDMKPLESEENAEKAVKQGKKQLKELVPKDAAQEIEVEVEAYIDRIADEGIIHAVEKYKPDLLVLSSHGRSGFKKFLLGSTTDKVMRSIECPVLMLKERCILAEEKK